MDIEKILETQEEAQRFIDAVQELLEQQAHGNVSKKYPSGMYVANIKRKSMDLTRSLAALRNQNRGV